MPFVMVLHENYHQYYAIHYNSLILEFTKNGNLFMCTRFEIDAKEPRKTPHFEYTYIIHPSIVQSKKLEWQVHKMKMIPNGSHSTSY